MALALFAALVLGGLVALVIGGIFYLANRLGRRAERAFETER